ncbi:MAG TPA: SMC-Scp complex subunit ScpB [Solirubrobacteraceae bacterium]|nr:SMC-Scp complex subunit ScpB [Solirubrobacteraceae bacterium]
MSDEATDPATELAHIVEATDSPAELARIVEALLFLSSDPLSVRELGDACGVPAEEIQAALALLGEQYAAGGRGIQLRELAGGYTLASDPIAEEAARRMLGRPRTATLTPAQAETLAIVAYLQPVSRPEITRIRGVSADSAAATLLERGLIEEAGRSQFGAVMYRTGTQFLKLFGLSSLQDLPDVAKWDPTPEEQSELRERLLRAGEARGGGAPPQLPLEGDRAVAQETGEADADELGGAGTDAEAGAEWIGQDGLGAEAAGEADAEQ